MKKILCIGSSTKDIFFPTSEGVVMDTPEDITSRKKIAFEMGAKYKISTRYETLGGCAANVACGLARLGARAACATTVGDDATGEWIKQELKKQGVDTELLRKEKDCQSDLSAIIVDEASGERTIFSNQKANEKLKLSSDQMKKYPWIFIGDLGGDWGSMLDEVMRAVVEQGIQIVFNPRQSNIHEDAGRIAGAFKYCEVVFLNKDEAIDVVSHVRKSFEKEQLDQETVLITSLKELGSKIVVITDGIRGAWVYDGNMLFHVEAVKVERAADTTGAGDAFLSGFFSAYLQGKDLAECAKWGVANSSHTVRFYGAGEGLLDEKDIIIHAQKVVSKEMNLAAMKKKAASPEFL